MVFQCTVVSFEIIYTQTVGYTCILLCVYIHICVTNIIKAKNKGYQFESGEHGCASRQDSWEEPEEQNGNDTILFQLRIFRK